MTASTVSRRTLLGLFAGAGFGLLVGCSDGGPSAEALVCNAVGDAPPGIVAIGARYRELYPDDDPSSIARDLPDDDRSDGEIPAALESLRRSVRLDFDAGDVVDVDGWVLARTEARAAAILSGC